VSLCGEFLAAAGIFSRTNPLLFPNRTGRQLKIGAALDILVGSQVVEYEVQSVKKYKALRSTKRYEVQSVTKYIELTGTAIKIHRVNDVDQFQ
jgi:hypothetical protein